MPAKIFSRQGLTLKLSSPHETDLRWLSDFLEPGFTTQPNQTADWEIRIRENIDDYSALLSKGTGVHHQTIPCFSFDNHIATHRLWSHSPLVIHDDEVRLFYIVDVGKQLVEVLSGERFLSIRVALLRLTREFTSHHLAQQGALHLHAAAISYADQGVLVCGPKKAGKTSFMIHALQHPEAELISNDRAILHNESSNGLMLSGMPTVITIRQGTMELFSRLGFANVRHWRARMSLDEALELGLCKDDPWPERLDLNPSQLCHLLRCRSRKAAPLKAVIFPMVDEGQSGAKLIRLPEELVAQKLRQNQFPLAASPFSTTAEVTPMADEAKQTTEHLSSRYPGFQCILGKGAFQGPSLCEQLFTVL